jgi:hypothetical protein
MNNCYIKSVESAIDLYVKEILNIKELLIYNDLLVKSVKSFWRFPIEFLTENLAEFEKVKTYNLVLILQKLQDLKLIDFSINGKSIVFSILD